MTTETGTVKWFNERQGLRLHRPGRRRQGPVCPLQGRSRATGFKTLTENQRVEFEVTQGQKGPQASRIRPL